MIGWKSGLIALLVAGTLAPGQTISGIDGCYYNLNTTPPECTGDRAACDRLQQDYDTVLEHICAGPVIEDTAVTVHSALETPAPKPNLAVKTGAGGVVVGTLSDTHPKPARTATLIDGKCSICAKEGKASRVYMDGFGSCTLPACSPGYYDERGEWVPPPPCNSCVTEGHCTRGHRVVVQTKQ